MRIPCECYNPNWDNYQEDEISWDHYGFPLHVTQYLICMVCDQSWSTRWLIQKAEDITLITTFEGEEE